MILNTKKIKNKFEPYLTERMYSRVYSHHFAENHLKIGTINSRDIKKSCIGISEYPPVLAAILSRLPRFCRDPAAILPR